MKPDMKHLRKYLRNIEQGSERLPALEAICGLLGENCEQLAETDSAAVVAQHALRSSSASERLLACKICCSLISEDCDIAFLETRGVTGSIVKLLATAPDEEAVADAAFVVGAIAARSSDDDARPRDLLIESGILAQLKGSLATKATSYSIETLRNFAVMFRNLFGPMPRPAFAQCVQVMPALRWFLGHKDAQLIEDSLWCLWFIVNAEDGDDKRGEHVISKDGLLETLVPLLGHKSPEVLVPLLKILSFIANEPFTELLAAKQEKLIVQSMLPALHAILQRRVGRVRRTGLMKRTRTGDDGGANGDEPPAWDENDVARSDTCCVLNYLSRIEACGQAFLDLGIVSTLVSICTSDDGRSSPQMEQNAALALANLLVLCNPKQRSALFKANAHVAFLDILSSRYDDEESQEDHLMVITAAEDMLLMFWEPHGHGYDGLQKHRQELEKAGAAEELLAAVEYMREMLTGQAEAESQGQLQQQQQRIDSCTGLLKRHLPDLAQQLQS